MAARGTTSVRRALAVTVVALSLAIPAHADEGLGVSTQLAGVVVSTSEALVGPSANGIGAEQVAGQCTYTGQTTPNGRMQYQYGGEAVASSTSPSQPQLTDVKCTLTSPAQGVPGELPTQTTSFEAACPLVACVSAGIVTGWPVRPVQVCIDGYAIFGPTPVRTASIIHACKTSTI